MENDSGTIYLAKTLNLDSFETAPSFRDIDYAPRFGRVSVIIIRVDNREMISPPNSATRVAGTSAGRFLQWGAALRIWGSVTNMSIILYRISCQLVLFFASFPLAG